MTWAWKETQSLKHSLEKRKIRFVEEISTQEFSWENKVEDVLNVKLAWEKNTQEENQKKRTDVHSFK